MPGPQTTAEDTPLTFGSATGNAITITDIENPRVVVALLVTDGILTLRSTAGLEFPYPDSVNNSKSITFIADSPAEANAALEGLVYTPAPDQHGPFLLGVQASDLTSPSYPTDSDWADVAITVTPVPDAPIAADDAYTAHEDNTLAIIAPGVLTNDSDPDGGSISLTLVSGPAHGTVALDPSGYFVYTPAPDYHGPDSFTYRLTNGGGLSDDATVSLTVVPFEDMIQVAVPGPQTVVEDGSLTFSAAAGTAITITDPDSPRVYVELGTYGILTLRSTAGLEFPYPEYTNNYGTIIFIADSPAEANAALEGLVFTPHPDDTSTIILDRPGPRPELPGHLRHRLARTSRSPSPR